MPKRLSASFALATCFTISLATIAFAGSGPCGTYFDPGYRAIGKTRTIANSTNGGAYILNDWNGDGRNDLWNFRWNAATSTQDIAIYLRLPGGYWDWDTPIILTSTLGNDATTGTSISFFYQLTDQNADGKTDFVQNTFGSTTGFSVAVRLNTGSALSAPVLTAVPGTDQNALLNTRGFEDLDGDDIRDHLYVIVTTSGETTLYFASGNANGTFDPPVLLLMPTADNELNGSSSLLGDFDGDGDVDILLIAPSSADRKLRLMKNNGSGTFTLGNPMSNGSFSLISTAASDANTDGRADFLVWRGSSVEFQYGQADGTFVSSPPLSGVIDPGSDVYPPVDFNADGRLDVVVVGNLNYQVYLRNADGTYTSQNYPRDISSGPRKFLYFEDFTGDGKADLYDANPNARLFNVLGEDVLEISDNVCESTYVVPRILDFDGSTFPELVNWNAATGQWSYGNALFGPTQTTPITTFQWGVTGDIPAPGDFDGDGKTDRTIFRNTDGYWYTLLSATGAWQVFKFGLPGDIAVPNDYNGGGQTDYAVFRPSEGNWYIWYTETQQFYGVHWGLNGDRPVPADYDGDGKTDIGVFRGSEGNWYYIRSSDQGFGIFHWGTNGDVALPGDYDGDRKADLAVYRTGVWYIHRSETGAIIILNWGTTGDIPIPLTYSRGITYAMVFRFGRYFRFALPVGFSLQIPGSTPVFHGLPNN